MKQKLMILEKANQILFERANQSNEKVANTSPIATQVKTNSVPSSVAKLPTLREEFVRKSLNDLRLTRQNLESVNSAYASKQKIKEKLSE